MYAHADSSISDDTAAEVSYFPNDAWLQNGGPQYYNSTYHYSRVPGAYVTLTFNGSFIAYLSDSNYDHGDFFISVDGRPAGTGSSYAPQAVPSVSVLFSAFLDPGIHILRIENAAASTIVGVDYFISSLAGAGNTSAGSSHVPTGTSTSASSEAGTGASSIALHLNAGQGIPRVAFYATVGVLCGLLAILAVGASVIAVRRRGMPVARRHTLPVDSQPTGLQTSPPPYSSEGTSAPEPPHSASSEAKSRAAGRSQTHFPPPDAIFDTAVAISL